ncbi:hypothetical protein CEXT_255151 [Caerostris extrusa]|uniref:Uncharacterized protein n=1 Tax=Caerostris extrusa TaxID=172846 RepID=A0AAV4Y8B0_CAEEX|nr:hypothetical protein CEXT_255151 [Caerostris extrusa]
MAMAGAPRGWANVSRALQKVDEEILLRHREISCAFIYKCSQHAFCFEKPKESGKKRVKANRILLSEAPALEQSLLT